VLLTHKSILTTIAGLDHFLKSLNEVVRFPALTSNVVLVPNYVQIFQLLWIIDFSYIVPILMDINFKVFIKSELYKLWVCVHAKIYLVNIFPLGICAGRWKWRLFFFSAISTYLWPSGGRNVCFYWLINWVLARSMAWTRYQQHLFIHQQSVIKVKWEIYLCHDGLVKRWTRQNVQWH